MKIIFGVYTVSGSNAMDNEIKEFLRHPEIIVVIVVIAIYMISKCCLKLGYLSVMDILKHHIDCFRNSKSKQIMIIPIFDYLIAPFVMGFVAAWMKIIDTGIVNIITVIVSVLTAMLFTLLGMIIDMKSKIKDNPNYFSTEAEISKKSLIETYYTVMFEILISVLLLILCLFNVFTKMFGFIQSFLIYSFTFLLIINLLMIMKRIYSVIDIDMRK